MASLNEVYQKFGEASEAAQLLETELGTLLVADEATRRGWLAEPDPPTAREAVDRVNRSTLGQLLRRIGDLEVPLQDASDLMADALAERNRLSHSFFRQHNYRRNSEAGRAIMLEDLRALHHTLFRAYKLVLRVSGIDLDKIGGVDIPVDHVHLD